MNHRVQVFGLDGTFVRQWGDEGEGPGQFSNPRGVAVVGGEVVVSDGLNYRVQVFGWDGTLVRQWGGEGDGPGQFKYPWGVAVKGNEVIVTDSLNHRVQVFGLDGIFVRQWDGEGDGPGRRRQLLDPCCVAVVGARVRCLLALQDTTACARCSNENIVPSEA